MTDLFHSRPQLSFNDWMAALNRLAERAGMNTPLEAETGEECWREYFDDGYSPGGAWAEECSYD